METQCIDIVNTLAACLVAGGADPNLANFLSILMGVILVATLPLVTVVLLIWVERKVAARIQDRIGPNRVGPYGLLQPVADALKMLTKEDITPAGADRFIYNLAPIIAFSMIILMWAVIPFSPAHVGADLSIGILYFIALGSIGTVKVMIGGWSSNNKYALLGAFRTIALLLSYEVPLILALLVPVMMTGTMSLQDITFAQGGMWFIVTAPLAALIFLIANQAETGRAPFDLIEAESELIAGYNIEYSGFKFGMFMAGEFLHVFTVAVLFSVLFLGGWWGPGVEQAPALGFIYLGAKTALVYLALLWVRNTLPRFRVDQVMALNWKIMVPGAIAVLLVQALALRLVDALGLTPVGGSFVESLPQTIILLGANLVLAFLFLNQARRQGRRQRAADLAVVRETRPVVSAPAGD
ncbi:MAG: NADH-quinone oxidoreductase subunit NuoH [Aggregatilineales bacterium]